MSSLTYSLEGTTAVLAMNDGKANALSDAMLDALIENLARAEKEAKAAILVGREGRFCAGFDLKVMMSSPENARALLRRGGDLFLSMYGSSIPLVVACSGHALAGGALVLLTGDARIGAEGAFKIGLNEVSIGLPLPILAIQLARDRLAFSELTPATLLARIYAPDEAVKAGYLDEIVTPAELLPRAKAEAERLGKLAGPSFFASKQRLRGQSIEHIRSTFDADMKAFSVTSTS